MEISSIFMIVVLIILVSLSAFFSSSETALASLNPIRLRQIARKKKKVFNNAKIAHDLHEDFSKVLTTILVGNNIVNILATSLSTVLFVNLFGQSGVAIATGVMTVVVLTFGEVLPKTIAASDPENFAIKIARPIYYFCVVLKPIVMFFDFIKRFVSTKFLKMDLSESVTATEEELLEIVQTIENEGVLEQDERELIESAIEFNEIRVRDIMIPRDEVIMLNQSASKQKVIDLFTEYKYSRIPIYNAKQKTIVGILYEREFLLNHVTGKATAIQTLMKKPFFVRKGAKIKDVLEELQRNKAHMAIVVDTLKSHNYVGIITLEDILEELVGEIYDEHDILPNDVVEIGHHFYEVSAHCLVEYLFDEFLEDSKVPKVKHQRVGHWLENDLGKNKKIKVNDVFNYDNLVITIKEMDKDKVSKIEIEELTKEDLFFK